MFFQKLFGFFRGCICGFFQHNFTQLENIKQVDLNFVDSPDQHLGNLLSFHINFPMHQEQYKLDCLFPFSSPDLAQRHINDLKKPAFRQFHFFEEVLWVLVGTLTKGLDVEEDFIGFGVVAGYSGRDLEAE
jgi:hypothetical protein